MLVEVNNMWDQRVVDTVYILSCTNFVRTALDWSELGKTAENKTLENLDFGFSALRLKKKMFSVFYYRTL